MGGKVARGCGIPRGIVLLQVFGFSGGPRWAQSVGPEHPWTLDTSQIRWLQKFGALWEAKMVAIWGFCDVKWGPFGVQNGYVRPFKGTKKGEKTPVDAVYHGAKIIGKDARGCGAGFLVSREAN